MKESDSEYRTRIANSPKFFGGSMLTVLIESKGEALDDVGEFYGVTREDREESGET